MPDYDITAADAPGEMLGGFSVDDARRIAEAVRIGESIGSNFNHPPAPDPPPDIDGITFHYVTSSGETLPPYGIVVATGIETRDQSTIIVADLPTTTFRRQILINGPREVLPGDYGQAQMGPIYYASYGTGSPAFGEGWGVQPGSSGLVKGFPGCTIYGIDDSTLKIALVTLEPINQLYAQMTGSLSSNATSGTSSSTAYKILTGTLGSETDSGFTTVPAAFNRGTALATNDYAWLAWTNNGWYIGKIC